MELNRVLQHITEENPNVLIILQFPMDWTRALEDMRDVYFSLVLRTVTVFYCGDCGGPIHLFTNVSALLPNMANTIVF
jgi:hypothetical protein